MFLVFNGCGWLVPITALVSIIGCGVVGLRYPRIAWNGMALSGLVDHHFGRKWNGVEGRLLQDLETGEVHEVKTTHSFFWIPMQHWLWVKIGIAALFVAIALNHGA